MKAHKLVTVLAAAGAVLLGATAFAQEWPSKPVHLICASTPGGPADILARATATKLSERLGSPFVVENRSGGDYIIATQYVLQQPPDGYTIFQGVSALPILPLTNRQLPFDTLRDLAAVTRTSTVPNVMLVHPSLPVNNLDELVAYAKANPGKLVYGAVGASGNPRLIMEQIKKLKGFEAEFVSYKGGPALIPDLLSGRTPLAVTGVGNIVEPVRSGKLRALMTLEPVRSDRLPEVPSTTEVGLPQVDSTAWFGLMLHGKTPRPIVDRLYRETVAILKTQELRDVHARLGYLVKWDDSPEAFSKRIAFEIENWARIAREANLKFE